MTVEDLEQRLARAIERGHLSTEEENDPEMVRLWRAHQKLEADWPTLDSDRPVIAVNREIPSEIGAIKITRCLGVGGFGEVFEGYHEKLKRKVAVKRALVPSLRGDSFVQEARRAAKVESPYVVTVYDVLTDVPDGPCIVSEYIDGESMDLWLKGKSLDLAAKLDLFEKIACGVDAAHQKFLMHRDLKPQNVMIDQAGLPHVTDFGLAKDLDPESGATQTREDGIKGTFEYMAPEQFVDTQNIDRRADVFALGVMLYELLTEERPYEGEDWVETFANIEKKVPLNPHETLGGNFLLKEKNFRDLSAICMTCVEKRPADRYQSIADLITDLEHYRKREPVSARHITKLERARRWAMRNPAMVAVILLVVLCAVGGPIWAIREARFSASQKRVNRMLTNVMSNLNWYIEFDSADLELKAHWAEISKQLNDIVKSPSPESPLELLQNFERLRANVSRIVNENIMTVLLPQFKVDQAELNKAAEQLENILQLLGHGKSMRISEDESQRIKDAYNMTFAEYLGLMEEDTVGNQGVVYLIQGKYARAEDLLERHVVNLRGHREVLPESKQWEINYELFQFLNNLGHSQRLSGDFQAAKDAYLEGLNCGLEATNANSSNTNFMQNVWFRHFFVFHFYPELSESELADKIALLEGELGKRGVDVAQLKINLQQIIEEVSAVSAKAVEVK